MLPLANRVHRGTDIRVVVKKGRRFNTMTSITYLLSDFEQENCQFGFICGKNVGGAVTRNLVVRRFRDCCGKYLKDDELRHLKVIFRIKPEAAQADFQRIEKDVGRAIRFAKTLQLSHRSGE